jgi:hypothetical protein
MAAAAGITIGGSSGDRTRDPRQSLSLSPSHRESFSAAQQSSLLGYSDHGTSSGHARKSSRTSNGLSLSLSQANSPVHADGGAFSFSRADSSRFSSDSVSSTTTAPKDVSTSTCTLLTLCSFSIPYSLCDGVAMIGLLLHASATVQSVC